MSAAVEGRSYLTHVHNFRGFAIVLIVFTHCLSAFDWSESPLLIKALKHVVANGTILFLFIAGYLFQHLSDRYRAWEYLWKKARFVALPYFLISIPALVLYTVFMPRPDMPAGFYEMQEWKQALFFLFTGSHLAPFWFIPTIVIFYLISPVLYWLDCKPWFYRLLPLLLLIPVFVSRGYLKPLQSFIHFLPIWVLGMACSRYRHSVTSWLDRWLWALLLLSILFLGFEMAFADGTHTWFSSLGKTVLTLGLFELFRRWGKGANSWFETVGTLSFGIFFLHSYVISVGKLGAEQVLGGLPGGSLLGVVVAGVVATIISKLLVRLVKQACGSSSRLFIGV